MSDEKKLLFQIIYDETPDGNDYAIIPGDDVMEQFGENPDWYMELCDRLVDTCAQVLTEQRELHTLPEGLMPYVTINTKYSLEEDRVRIAMHPTAEFEAMYGLDQDTEQADNIYDMLPDLQRDIEVAINDFNSNAKLINETKLEEGFLAEAIMKQFKIDAWLSTDRGFMLDLSHNSGLDDLMDQLDEKQLEKFMEKMGEYFSEISEKTETLLNDLYELADY